MLLESLIVSGNAEQVANDTVDIISFDRKSMRAEAHIHPSMNVRRPMSARGNQQQDDPTKLGDLFENVLYCGYEMSVLKQMI